MIEDVVQWFSDQYQTFIDWLYSLYTTFTDWVYSLFSCTWDAFVSFLTDFAVATFRLFAEAIIDFILAVPLPESLTTGAASLWSELDPGIVYFLSQSGLVEALAILSSGLVFRILRKVVTLGRW